MMEVTIDQPISKLRRIKMRKMKKVFGMCVSTLLVLSMVLSSALYATAAEAPASKTYAIKLADKNEANVYKLFETVIRDKVDASAAISQKDENGLYTVGNRKFEIKNIDNDNIEIVEKIDVPAEYDYLNSKNESITAIAADAIVVDKDANTKYVAGNKLSEVDNIAVYNGRQEFGPWTRDNNGADMNVSKKPAKTFDATAVRDEVEAGDGIVVVNQKADVQKINNVKEKCNDVFTSLTAWIYGSREAEAKHYANERIKVLVARGVAESTISSEVYSVNLAGTRCFKLSYIENEGAPVEETVKTTTYSADVYTKQEVKAASVEEKTIARTYKVSFNNESSNVGSLLVLEGTTFDSVKSLISNPSKSATYTNGSVAEDGTKTAGELRKYSFKGWNARESYNGESIKEDRVYDAKYASWTEDAVQFFVRVSNEEQLENGKTHYDDKYYTPKSDKVYGSIVEFKNIYGEIDANETFEEIVNNLASELPKVEDFTYAKEDQGKFTSLKNYIRWYVLKEESDRWHIDGIIKANPTVKFVDEDAVTILNPEKENDEFFVQYNSKVVLPTQTITKANSADGTKSYRHIGWVQINKAQTVALDADGQNAAIVLSDEEVAAISATEDLVFMAVYEESEVKGESFENPDKKDEDKDDEKLDDKKDDDKDDEKLDDKKDINEDDSEVLGAVFGDDTDDTDDTDENGSAVLGAEFAATGDSTNLFVMVGILLMSGASIVLVIRRKREM